MVAEETGKGGGKRLPLCFTVSVECKTRRLVIRLPFGALGASSLTSCAFPVEISIYPRSGRSGGWVRGGIMPHTMLKLTCDTGFEIEEGMRGKVKQ